MALGQSKVLMKKKLSFVDRETPTIYSDLKHLSSLRIKEEKKNTGLGF